MEEKIETKNHWPRRKKILAVFASILITCLLFAFYFLYHFMLAYPSAFGILGDIAYEFHKL